MVVTVENASSSVNGDTMAVPRYDEFLERFLASRKGSTANGYRGDFIKYVFPFMDQQEFAGRHFKTFRECIDAIKRDNALTSDETSYLENDFVTKFVAYLSKQKTRQGKSLSANTLNRIFGAFQSGCSFYKLPISRDYVSLPKAVPETVSFAWSIQYYELHLALLKHADYQALSSCAFQSGSGVGDVLIRPYNLIQKGYESQLDSIAKQSVFLSTSKTCRLSSEYPLKSVVFMERRQKTGVAHRTCYGPESLVLLKRYFDEKYGENGTPKAEDRIFPMQRRPIDELFAVRAKVLIGDWPYRNPMGIHGFRKFFRKRMVKEGKCPSEYAEYFMAHQLKGDMRKTYSEMDDREWLQIYEEYEPTFLSFRILPLAVAEKELKTLLAVSA